ncbi:UPF0739 protein C1orf74 homolog [Amphiura filiformis]|uniref:UPF0739 protein C1orf74 homolog n=1 Tax=Amphiura filiformis TaxID=82378 RepID=UPI003B20BE78
MDTRLKSLVLKHIGKAAHKYWRAVACDIIAVCQGIKPGFLYDYGAVSSHSLAALTSDVFQTISHEQSKGGKKCDMCVITLEQDVMLVNIEALYRRLEEQEHCMESSTSNIIDVSENLKSPQILSFSSPHGIKLKQELHRFCAQCKQLLSKRNVDVKVAEVELPETENFNLTTIFGLLIGYPVFYWYQGGAEAANCLDMVPLIVYEIVCDLRNNFTDSQSQTSHTYDGFQSSTKHCDGSKAESLPSKDDDLLKSGHAVYSFSIPECVSDHCRERIHSWFHNLQDGVTKTLITNLQMSQKTVNLPSVAL